MSCDICGKNNCERAFHSVQMQQVRDDALNSDKNNLLSELAALRKQLKDCSAVVDRQQEQLDRNAKQRKPWVGLTHEEHEEINKYFLDNWARYYSYHGCFREVMRWQEERLKEKNT